MLTRSPVQPSPANSSPRSSFHSFHYASAAGHHQSPSRISVLSRRQSNSSASGTSATAAPVPSSPAYPRPKRYVGVDASTQYSPMEPAGAPGANEAAAPPPPQPESQPASAAPPPIPGLMPMTEAGGERPQPAKATTPSMKQSHLPHNPAHTASPNKRRNSQGPGGGSGLPESSTLNSPVLSKRVKADTALPKVLPQRYELCPVEDVVVLIANMLGELIETNDALALRSGHLTRFHSRYDKHPTLLPTT